METQIVEHRLLAEVLVTKDLYHYALISLEWRSLDHQILVQAIQLKQLD